MNVAQKDIILFDGVCNFCNAAINFIIAHDKSNRYMFAPLQSEAGQRLLKAHHLSETKLDTFILIEKNITYTSSTAALRVARHLSGLYALLSVFLILPAFTRNWAYNIVAKNRYRWFGKKDVCMVPAPEIKNRFLS